MNEEAKARLNTILEKDKSVLTKEDKEFLRARRSYLTSAQKEDYQKELVEKEAPKKTADKAANQTSNKETVKKNDESKSK